MPRAEDEVGAATPEVLAAKPAPEKTAEDRGPPRGGNSRRGLATPLLLLSIILPLLLLTGNALGQRPQRQGMQPTATKKPARPRAKTVTDLFNTSSCAGPPFRCPYPRIEFYLYTRSTQEEPEKLDLLKDAGPALMETQFDAAHPTKVVIHGFGGGRKLSPSPDMRKAYFTRGEYNVIIVDYSSLVVEPCLSQVEWAPRFCALCIAQLIGWLDDAWRWSIQSLLSSTNRVTRQAGTASRYRNFNDYDDEGDDGGSTASAQDGDFGQRVVQLIGKTAGRTMEQGGDARGGGVRIEGSTRGPGRGAGDNDNTGARGNLLRVPTGNESPGRSRGNAQGVTRGNLQYIVVGNDAVARGNEARGRGRGNSLGITRENLQYIVVGGDAVTRGNIPGAIRGNSARMQEQDEVRGNVKEVATVNIQGASRVNVQGANRANLQSLSRENAQDITGGRQQNVGRVNVHGVSRVNLQGVGRGNVQGFNRGNAQDDARQNILSVARINALVDKTKTGDGGNSGSSGADAKEVVSSAPRRLRFVGSPPQGVHVIGYSVGAHIAGLIANYVGEKKIGRITGLDPTIIFYMGSNRSRDLDPTDALFVDVIHTGAGVLGQWGPNGHVDFYVNGGTSQPGCTGGIYETLACDHQKVTPYFIESITSERGFWATPCSNLLLYLIGWCTTTERSKLIKMGEDVPRSARGIYYLETNARKPYAKGLPPDVTRRKRRGRG